MWYGANYRFYRAQPYLYQSGEMAFLEGFGDDKDNDNLLWKVVSYNHNKQVLGSRCYEYETMQTPVRRIPQAKVFLYKQPRETAVTKNYIIKNDLVSILEVKETDTGQWLKIVYRSRKLGWIKRWIRL
jgi:GW (Gly-Tryp) dipeptide domain